MTALLGLGWLNPAWWHLMLVHLPIVGVPFCLLLWVTALLRRDAFLLHFTSSIVLVLVVVSIGAYLTGPPAYELLTTDYDVSSELIEDHAVIGKAAFVAMLVLGGIVLNVLLAKPMRGTPAGPVVRWSVVVLMLLTIGLLGWSAHLGALIRHPELHADLLSSVH